MQRCVAPISAKYDQNNLDHFGFIQFQRILRKQAEVRKFLSLQLMEIQQRPHVTVVMYPVNIFA